MMKTAEITALIFILLFSAANIHSVEAADRQIGIIYLKNAAGSYLLEDYDQSVNMLQKAEEFYDGSSDSVYLSGLIKMEMQNDINSGIEFFNKAIDRNNWLILDRRDCISDLALLLFRTKQYEAVLELVEKTSPPGYNDNDLMYIYLLSLEYAGKNTEYQTWLVRSISDYPDDYRFASLYIHQNSEYKQEVLSGSHDFKNKDGALEVFLEAALTLDDSPEKIRYLEQYIAAKGKSIEAYTEYYRLKGGADNAELEELIEMGIMEYPRLRNKFEAFLPSIEMRRKLKQAKEEFTGNIYFDLNSDNFYEELYLYEYGIPAGLSIDENQDGVLEKMIIFNDGLPAELIITDKYFTRVVFDKYPYVDEVSISDEDLMDVYSFMEENVVLDFYSIRESDDKFILDENLINNFITDRDSLKSNALRIATYTGGENKDNFTFLRKEWERLDRHSSILTVYDNLRGNYIYHHRNDEKTAGFADIDLDNLVDLRENYLDGELASIQADVDQNGAYEFMVSYTEDTAVMWWDYNEDGIYDSRQYEIDGSTITEYSTKLDGVFDIIERDN